MLEFTAVDIKNPGPAEAPDQEADRPQNTQVQKGVKMEAIPGPQPAVPQ